MVGSVREGWPEVADFNDNVMKVGLAGGTLAYRDQELTLYRTGRAEQVWMDLDYSPVLDEAGRPAGVLAIVIETTARVRAEQSLREERDRSRGVLDGMAEGFALLDREFRIVDVNREAMRLGTRPREDIVGRTHWQAYPGTEQSELGGLYRRAMAERVPVSLEHHHRWEDGREAWIEMRAYPVEQGLAVFYRDITARRAGEAALRESEARFRDVANSIDQMVWSTRPDGFHDFYNQRWYEFIGVPEGSTDGEAWNGMFHSDDQDRAWARWRHSLATGEPYEIEYRLCHRSGAYRWVLGRANAIRDDAGRITRWYGTCTDVHDQKLAEEALRRSERSLLDLNAELERKVIERSRERGLTWQITPDLIGVCNAEGYFESTNPAWESVLGWSEEEIRTTPFSDFLHPDDLEKTDAAFARLTRGLPLLRFENRYRTKDGSCRWLWWVAVPEGGKFYCSARDVTAEKEQEAELAARTTERDRLWRNTQDIQVVIDGGGTFLNVNPAFTRTLGWSHEQAIGQTVFDFVVPDDEAPTGGALAHARNDALPTFENRYRHRDGGFRWISWVAAPEGELIYASGRNITAEKEQAAELAAAQEALRQSQKMEAVGQLTGGIAHDFNNMLAVVIGSLDLLGRRLGTADPRSKRYLDAAADGARRAALLTQRLLAFSRQQPLRPEAIDVNRLVSGMSELVRGSMGSDIRLETVLGGGVWRTHADPNQLENVILNLAVNARDAMPEGGRLTIETQNAHLNARYVAAHLGVPAGQYVLIAVTDTGTGMPPEVIAKAFDPFFTTKEVGKGTGLGLSQVYGFIKQSDGHVKIYSEPGQGTTIKLYLPRLTGASLDADEEKSSPTFLSATCRRRYWWWRTSRPSVSSASTRSSNSAIACWKRTGPPPPCACSRLIPRSRSCSPMLSCRT